MESAKLRPLALYRYLAENTDEQHHAHMDQLTAYMEQEGFSGRRQSIYEDIALLQESGFDIIRERTGYGTGYYLASRPFEQPEVKLLVDVVSASPFLTKAKSQALIKKLLTLTSKHQAKNMQQQVYVLGRVKNNNEQIYYSIDAINEAISSQKKIAFQYADWDISGKKVLRHNGQVYLVSPVALCMDKNYYLVTFNASENEFRNYRVDRMVQLHVAEESSETVPADFNLTDYVMRNFNMYHGEEVTLQLEFASSLLNSMIDRFGSDVFMHPINESTYTLTTKVDLSPTFYSWLLCFGSRVKIVSPQKAIDGYCNLLASSLEKYQ